MSYWADISGLRVTDSVSHKSDGPLFNLKLCVPSTSSFKFVYHFWQFLASSAKNLVAEHWHFNEFIHRKRCKLISFAGTIKIFSLPRALGGSSPSPQTPYPVHIWRVGAPSRRFATAAIPTWGPLTWSATSRIALHLITLLPIKPIVSSLVPCDLKTGLIFLVYCRV